MAMRISAKPNPRKKNLHTKIDYLLLDLLEDECIKTRRPKSHILAEALADRYGRQLDDECCILLSEKETVEIEAVNEKIREIDDLIIQLKKQRTELLKI